jgi:peptidoglycan/LPS O-acetylase OafA/YrhL
VSPSRVAQRLRRWRPPTVADCLASGRDNFLALRAAAATLVIYGHAWPLGNGDGVVEWLSLVWGTFSATVAVNAFFFVSGLLVTMSWTRRRSLRSFARARALRIYPALLVCVVLCACVLGPAVTTLSPAEYFSRGRLYSFLLVNGSLATFQADLPGVFETNRHAAAVNGSLWTLPAELRMYAHVAALGSIGALESRKRFAIALACLATAATVAGPYVWLLRSHAYDGFVAFFAAGATCWMFRDHIPVSGALLAALVVLCVAARPTAAYGPVFAATTAYFCLWFAFLPRRSGRRRAADYSYGLYLYGFPMQQLIAWRWPSLGPWPLFAASLALAFVLAAASWHWIEKPALARKERQARSDPFSCCAPSAAPSRW